MTAPDTFTRQFAIRLPSGELFAQRKGGYIFGGSHAHEVLVLNTREQAETILGALATQAAELGITGWVGQIESRLCSPFSVTDPSEQFAAEVEKWAAQQGGDS